MKYIFKIVVLFSFAAILGTLGSAAYFVDGGKFSDKVAKTNINISEDYISFADDVINSSVFISSIDLISNQPMSTGTGSVIKTKFENGKTKLYILSAAHLLKSACKYSSEIIFVHHGHIVNILSFDIVETEYVDKDLDLVLFEAEINGKLPATITNKSLDTLHSKDAYLHKVIISSYPKAVGPIYSEGYITTSTENAILCNIIADFGSSGGVIYDLETHKIAGVLTIAIMNERGSIIHNVMGLVVGENVEKFLKTCKILL